jgi:hypothetical protein
LTTFRQDYSYLFMTIVIPLNTKDLKSKKTTPNN